MIDEEYFTLQVLGDGNKRILTLTHRCQVKRFFNDLVRILKNKPQRSMAISEIPREFSKTKNAQTDSNCLDLRRSF